MKIQIITLVLALIQVESNNNNDAIGDCGKAYGCLQIHQSYVTDVAKASGIPYVHEDAFDREKSIDMFLIYMSIYATEARLGRKPTAQDMARIHNGGPDGWKKPHTIKYWKKVEAIIDANTII
tara:strand:- start:115 stop:483 length:369 start_codon:yes stop_codon:yes gene_type:complete